MELFTMLDKMRYITDDTTASRYVHKLKAEPVIGVDIETMSLPQYADHKQGGLDPYLSRPRLFQAATLDGRVAVFDLLHIPVTTLQPLSARPWAVFNGSFEWRHLTHAGLTLPRLHDVMLLDRLVTHKLHRLDEVVETMMYMPMDKTLQTSDWAGELSTEQIEYAAFDALMTVRCGDRLLKQVTRYHQRRLYDLWCNAQPVLADLSYRGHTFDWAAHEALAAGWADEKDELLQALKAHLGDINPNSGTQLGLWLQDTLDTVTLDKWPKTPKGKLKTNIDTLILNADHPAVLPLLRYKKINKLLSTYDQGYLKHKHPVTGKLHTSFSIGRTVSGRLSSFSPNLQNAPRQDWFRSLFITEAGRVMVGADYSQIELRVAALLANDRNLIDAYRMGVDLHSKTAAEMSGVAIDKVTKAQRQSAKAVNFGNLFAQGANGLSRTAKTSYDAELSVPDAKRALLTFARAYPELDAWKKKRHSEAVSFRRVHTKLGLIRDFDIQGEGYLKADCCNIPIQGSAAEVLLSAITRLPTALNGVDAKLAHNVHDEILLDVSPGDADKAQSALKHAMVEGFLDVFPEGEPIAGDLVEAKIGNNWAQAH
jgi:DNA polymerase-1